MVFLNSIRTPDIFYWYFNNMTLADWVLELAHGYYLSYLLRVEQQSWVVSNHRCASYRNSHGLYGPQGIPMGMGMY